MKLVLASRYDAAAAHLVEQWADRDVRLATCETLSTPGWSWRLGHPDDATIGLDGSVVAVAEITAVLCLLPTVTPDELPHIAAGEQQYVAHELMACLLAWLSALGSRVLNPPSPLCLTGPHLHPEQWFEHAASAGLPIGPHRRRSERYLPDDSPHLTRAIEEDAEAHAVRSPAGAVEIPVVAGRAVGPAADTVVDVDAVEQLSRTTRAGLLTAVFVPGSDDRLRFDGATPSVDVRRDDVADKLGRALGVTA